MNLVFAAIEVTLAFVSLIFFLSCAVSYSEDKKNCLLSLLFLCVGLSLICNAATFLLDGQVKLNLLNRFMWSLDYALVYVCEAIFHFYILQFVPIQGVKRKALECVVFPLGLVLNVFWSASHWTEWFFRFSSDGYGAYASLYPLAQIGSGLLIGFDLILVICYHKSLGPRATSVFMFYAALPLTATIYSKAIGSVVGIYISMFVGILLSYNFLYISSRFDLLEKQLLLAQSEKQLLETQAALQERNTALMLSQIQPHFIYNALATISHLCKKDPALAKKATDTFSDYLRTNLTTMYEKSVIPFKKEIEHIKTYLWLEQLRFGEDIQVDYDIQTEDFFVPTLSIQPLVENAVKHGLCQNENGGTIFIQSKAKGNGVQIIIHDNGIGFNPSILNSMDNEHTGIHNVRFRLESICSATLTLSSTTGKGTTVTIFIPKENP